MGAYRCSRCSVNWPSALNLKRCPECNAGTLSFLGSATPLSLDEARKRKAEAEFKRFYEDEWEPARIARGDLSPEEIGRREAREEIARIRRLNQEFKAA